MRLYRFLLDSKSEVYVLAPDMQTALTAYQKRFKVMYSVELVEKVTCSYILAQSDRGFLTYGQGYNQDEVGIRLNEVVAGE